MRIPFLKRETRLVGIDLGSSALKLVELERAGDGFRVRAQGMVDAPRDMIVENEVLDSALFIETVAALVDGASPSTKRAAVALAGSAVFNKVIQLPHATEFELETSIEETAADYIPFAIEEVYLDFAIQGVNADDPDAMDVALVACKRELIDDLQLVLMDAGLELAVVDYAGFALQNAASLVLDAEEGADEEGEEAPEEEPRATMLVNVGAHMTTVNILGEDRSLFVRDHYFGGERLTQMIQEARGVGFAKAEAMKRQGAFDDEVRDRFFDEMESELGRSIDFFASSFARHKVERMLFAGGGACCPGLIEAMGERFSIPAEPLDVAPALGGALREGGRMAMAVGLAMRAFDDDA